MPYITKEEVKVKRELIKKSFPEFRFSIRVDNGSMICVSIMSGPKLDLELNRGYENVNHFYIKDHYEKESPKTCKLLEGIYEILNHGNYTVVHDSDYGNVPNFYVDLEIGRWDKKYEVKEHKLTKKQRENSIWY